MGLWEKLFGNKYMSWEEYQNRMQALEDEVWERKGLRLPRKKPILPKGIKLR